MAKCMPPLPPSKSMVVPLQMLRPDNNAGDYSSHRQLMLLPHTTTSITTTSRNFTFQLPVGWGVEEVPRPDSSRVDKYYYEPGTGHKFRSLRAVERYINGDEYTPRSRAFILHNSCKKPSYSKNIICGGKVVRLGEQEFSQGQLAIVASSNTEATSAINLPNGWIIEEVPRNYGGFTDKYYYEPGTGRKFRSHVSVLRHLEELEEDMPLSAALEVIKENTPLSKAFKLGHLGKNSVSRKRKSATINVQTSAFLSPPKKINWVLASPRGDAWNAFIFETPVPDSEKQQWNKRFMLAMNYGNPATQNSGTTS